MKSTSKILVALLIVVLLGSLSSTVGIAQEEGGGFSEDFDEVNWDGWEHSQDITVENGVLTLGGESMVMRVQGWSEIDLSVRLRINLPGEMVVNYYMGDQGHYALILIGNMAILERITEGTPTGLAEGAVGNFNDGDWNDINIQVVGGNHTITINEVAVITTTDSDPLSGGAVMLHSLGETTVDIDSISLTGNLAEGPMQEGGEPVEEGEPEPGEERPPDGQPGEGVGVADATDGADQGQTLLEEFMSGQSNQLELSTFLINLLLAVVASFILGRVYVYWGTSLSNRRAFASNFILLTVTTTFIILVVRSSVALSLGLVGALSIVRFRAAVKEPEELAYLFFAISLGIGLGDNQRLITLLTLLVGIAVIGLLHVFRKGGADVNLHLTIASKNPYKVELDQVTAVLEKHCSKIKLLRYDETEQVLETSYLIEFKRVSDLSKAKAELHSLSDRMDISFLDNKGIW